MNRHSIGNVLKTRPAKRHLAPQRDMRCVWMGAAMFIACGGGSLLQAGPICAEWEVVPSPVRDDSSVFQGVHGTASDDVWAVGYSNDYYDPLRYNPLTLTAHWDGSTWTHVPSPSPGLFPGGGTRVYLNEVRAVASDDVWAVGTYWTQHPVDFFVGYQTLALHWDGSEWTQVPTPVTPVGGTGAGLEDIEHLGPDAVWAVGQRVDPPSSRLSIGLALRWDGSEWTEMPALPTPGRNWNLLRALEVFAADDIMAVGGHSGDSNAYPDRAWIVRWDGSRWSDLTFPRIALRMFPQDIAASSPHDVWVVGSYNDDSTQQILPLIMHFDGSQWTYHEPGFDLRHIDLRGVTAIAPNDVWATGTFSLSSSDPYSRPLLLHYDGQAWTKVETDPAGANYGLMWDIFAVNACDMWAVGQSSDTGHTETQRLFGDGGTFDLSLAQTGLQRGRPATFTVTGAEPGEAVDYLYSLNGVGSGPCPPQLGGLCLDLVNPVTRLGSATADSSGTARLALLVPPAAPLTNVSTQAVVRRGSQGEASVKSNTVSDTIRP